MAGITDKEMERQYRVLRQTQSIHAMLRDELSLKANAAEILLLACSVVFCATAFASDELYEVFSLAPQYGRIILSIASILAFILALSFLIVDWKGRSAQHGDSAARWSNVLVKFREYRGEDGTWPEDKKNELSSAYWETARNSVEIPERQFNTLKSRYLRKVAISKWKSAYPGCPRFVLWLFLRGRDTFAAMKLLRSTDER